MLEVGTSRLLNEIRLMCRRKTILELPLGITCLGAKAGVRTPVLKTHNQITNISGHKF